MKTQYLLSALLTCSMAAGLVACSQPETSSSHADDLKIVTLIVRDNPPYPQISEYVRDKVKKQHIDLRIKYANDGLIPNKAVAENEIDLNFFQHQFYMQAAKDLNHWDLVPIASTFNGLFGAYSPKYKNINDLPDKAKIVIPADPSNGGRALNLLASAKLIELKPHTGAKTSLKDISSNPKHFQFTEVEHALVPVSFKDADLAIMGGAYTVHANLLPKRDAIYLEKNSIAYDSVLVSNSKAAKKPEVQAVKAAFLTEDTREYTLKNFADTVIWPKR